VRAIPDTHGFLCVYVRKGLLCIKCYEEKRLIKHEHDLNCYNGDDLDAAPICELHKWELDA
jgi:hypothetical protein